MAQDSNIQWTTHTFNPWSGCTKVSDGCKFCYAETLMDKRYGKAKWGPSGTRVVKAESGWREPLKWNRLAEQAGERHRVFCASLADVFEGDDTMPVAEWSKVEEARKRLFDLITRTPHLDWLLLTKRPQNALETMVRAGLYAVANPSLPCPQPNIWIGTSVEDQQAADERIPHLLRVPAAVRFLSAEPLLGPVNLESQKFLSFPEPCVRQGDGTRPYTETMAACPSYYDGCNCLGIHWVIVGGESGYGARPFNVQWARSIVNQCKAAGVAVFVKQVGSNPVWTEDREWVEGPRSGRYVVSDKKGGNPEEWDESIRVREFPA